VVSTPDDRRAAVTVRNVQHRQRVAQTRLGNKSDISMPISVFIGSSEPAGSRSDVTATFLDHPYSF
jgi:hypothetical protein